jgi:hypothetical protein
LISGEVDYFMGFHFLQTTELTKAGRVRSCYAYAEGGKYQGEHGGHNGQCFPKQYHYGDPLIQLRLHLQFG